MGTDRESAKRRRVRVEIERSLGVGSYAALDRFMASIPVPDEVADAEAAMHVDEFEDMFFDEGY